MIINSVETEVLSLVEKVKSNIDKTVKYVFKTKDNLIVEVNYIDNNTGKDIICVASQTMCSMACSFCHLTDYIGKIKLRNLTSSEIVDSVTYIVDDLKLNQRTLLISYMGCGEPLLNYPNVEKSILVLMKIYSNIRFGLSTMLPKGNWKAIIEAAQHVSHFEIPLKMHLSLHYTQDAHRNEKMPNATNIKASIAALEFYKEITGQPVEVHYTLIKNENDSDDDISNLKQLLKNRGIGIKFLRFNDKASSQNEKTEITRIYTFMEVLRAHGITAEYYEPPGKDVGASCGQFLFDQYTKLD